MDPTKSHIFVIGNSADTDFLRKIVNTGQIEGYSWSNNDDGEYIESAQIQKEINDYVRRNLPEIRRGDLVSLLPNEDRYRNEGLWIWSGSRVEKLASKYNEYLHVPQQYPVITEFPLNYWVGKVVSPLVQVDVEKLSGGDPESADLQIALVNEGGIGSPISTIHWKVEWKGKHYNLYFQDFETVVTVEQVRDLLGRHQFMPFTICGDSLDTLYINVRYQPECDDDDDYVD